MRRNGIGNESNKGNSQAMIQEFIEETKCHPCLLPEKESVITSNLNGNLSE